MHCNSSRRRFLSLLAASAAASACSDAIPPDRYTQDDIELLAKQRLDEAAASGQGRFGLQRYAGYQGLSELPWFELDENQQLICVDESVPPAIDVHCHLGMRVLFKPKLNQHESSQRVQHLLDCQADCELDLDVYMNANFSNKALRHLKRTLLTQGLWGNEVVRTHTMANLINEMDSMRVDKAILLPIKFGLPFGDDLTEQWRRDAQKPVFNNRLLSGFSVDPHAENAIEEFRQHAAKGFKIVKLHPPLQKFFPDDTKLMPLYEEAQSSGVVVFFHGGRAGIEPESSHPYAMPRHYEAALKNFPKLNFILGHGGARDGDAMLELMLKYPNAWLGLQGQGLSKLDNIIDRSRGQRLLFGTDWPFYHIAPSLAKILMVTEAPGRMALRRRLLRDNAVSLFASI